MPSPFSVDLRERVMAAVAEGASCHAMPCHAMGRRRTSASVCLVPAIGQSVFGRQVRSQPSRRAAHTLEPPRVGFDRPTRRIPTTFRNQTARPLRTLAPTVST